LRAPVRRDKVLHRVNPSRKLKMIGFSISPKGFAIRLRMRAS